MIEEKDILFRDDYFVAINKPPGLLVHRTSLSEEGDEFALQQVRDLVGQKIYPIHRLDRPTSGVLIFGLNPDIVTEMREIFKERTINKHYVALVRGWFPKEPVHLDYPVKNVKDKLQDAVTEFRLAEHYELSIPVEPYVTSRYSVVNAFPKTGRWHQIRQHLAHLRYYIINDRVHGTGAHNAMFTQRLGLSDMFLHAQSLSFVHPATGKELLIEAKFPKHWDDFKFFTYLYAL